MRIPFAVLACTALAVAASGAHAGQDYAPSAHMPADGSRSHVVAEIDGQPLTFASLLDEAHSDLQHQQDVYDIRREGLDIDYQRAEQSTLEDKLKTVIDQRLLDIEAKARHTTPLKLLGNVNASEVTDGEVRALYDARKLPGTPPFDQVKTMIRSSLQSQKTQAALDGYYKRLRAKYGVKDFLEPLRQQVAAIGPSLGPADAPVTIIEFGDYQCPFCHQLEPTLESVLKQYSHQARLVFRNFPLTEIHPEALHAAQAAVCADKQGKFWAMHDALYADDTPLSISSLRTLAKQVGLDSKKFEACVRNGAADATINADIKAGDDLAVEGTPTLFIDGRYLNGTVPREQLVAIIQDELKRHTRQSVTASR